MPENFEGPFAYQMSSKEVEDLQILSSLSEKFQVINMTR